MVPFGKVAGDGDVYSATAQTSAVAFGTMREQKTVESKDAAPSTVACKRFVTANEKKKGVIFMLDFSCKGSKKALMKL